MTINWTLVLLDSRVPETVEEAVDRLMMILDDAQLNSITVMPEENLFTLHFSLGIAIRNAFSLHESGSNLLASCGAAHPDDASELIIKKLWIKLNHGD
ncbi:MAG: hypothetical protein Q8L15_12100 [Methylobacter sp.]|nr:hypothetical protein [Methylobacter sp.]